MHGSEALGLGCHLEQYQPLQRCLPNQPQPWELEPSMAELISPGLGTRAQAIRRLSLTITPA
jgi:hypothetical protein